jgi:hypothetical protein
VIIGAILFATFIGVTGSPSRWRTSFAQSGDRHDRRHGLVLLIGSFLDGLALMLGDSDLPSDRTGSGPQRDLVRHLPGSHDGDHFVHPLGLNIIIQGIGKDIPIGKIFRGVIPFLTADFLHLMMLIVFPSSVSAAAGDGTGRNPSRAMAAFCPAVQCC